MCGLAFMTACNSGLIAEQYREQVSINEVTLGESNALSATIIPGNVQASSEERIDDQDIQRDVLVVRSDPLHDP